MTNSIASLKNFALGFIALGFSAFASQALAQDTGSQPPPVQEEDNSGQDPTRPVTRLDLRIKYQDDPSGYNSQVFTLRADKPFLLGGNWKLNARVDIPFIRTNTITLDNLDGDHDVGVGDILIQALMVTPPKGKLAFAFGTQLLIPTGGEDQFTSGKWQFVPTAAAVYQIPEIRPGSFVAIIIRDRFSFAGDGARPDINVVTVQPYLNIALPERWFISIGPEIEFNTKDDWEMFLPADITVGKKINPATVVSLQGNAALIDDYEQYDWKLEFRVGFLLAHARYSCGQTEDRNRGWRRSSGR